MNSPEEKIAGGRSLIRFLADATSQASVKNDFSEVMREEWERRVSVCSPASLYHDELGPHNHHFYFHEFMARAQAHGLQFLAEADFPAMQAGNFRPEVGERLKELEEDVIAREQYLDFLKGRRFRQTLLCRKSIPLERDIPGERVASLLVSSKALPSEAPGDLTATASVEFCGPHNSSISTPHPLIKSALLCLAEHWPQPLSLPVLTELARHRLEAAGATSRFDMPEDRTALLTTFFLCFGAGLLNFHTWAPPLTIRAGSRPLASPLARLQLHLGKQVTTLCHERMEIEGDLAKVFIQLLDGTRNRNLILDALEEALLTGKASLPEEEKPASEGEVPLRKSLSNGLETRLEQLGRMGLLMG
jgi:methyltransferase-like protein